MSLIDFEPTVLTFPIELRKQSTCTLRLFNKTDKHVAFKVKTTTPKKYCVKPNTGLLAPRSTCYVVVAMSAPKEFPADMQCKDKFLVQSTITKAGVSENDLVHEMFSKDLGNVVEAQKFYVAYVLPNKLPASFAEVFSDGCSFSDGPEILASKDLNSMVTTTKEIRLNLVVDNDKGRVIHAETDGRFVDILLSFLTLPIGAIVRLLDMNSGLGSMDKLCESVDNLSSKYLKTSGQSLLLRPERPLHSCFWNLVNWNKSHARKYCLCKKMIENGDICTEPRSTTCLCGIRSYCNCVNCPVVDGEEDDKNGLLFLKADTRFIVRDDLLISPIFRERSIFSVFQELGVCVGENVHEMTVTINEEDGMMRNLLKRSLVSLTPLSDIFLPQRKEKMNIGNEIRSIDSAEGRGPNLQFCGIKIKIVKSTVNHKVLYAEAGADFVNILLNLSTYHIGSLSSLPQGHPITCFRNLYRSANAFDTAEHFKSERCKSTLLSSELSNKLCESVLKDDDISWRPSEANNDGFVKEGYTFMVTDDLGVTPMSGSSVLSVLREFNCTTMEVEECEVVVGRNEVEDLVIVSLTSKMALSRTFLRR